MPDYYIERGGAHAGPFPLSSLLAEGVTPTTLVWCAGMAQWMPAEDVPELSPLFGAVPPPLPLSEVPGTQGWVSSTGQTEYEACAIGAVNSVPAESNALEQQNDRVVKWGTLLLVLALSWGLWTVFNKAKHSYRHQTTRAQLATGKKRAVPRRPRNGVQKEESGSEKPVTEDFYE